jgi:general secretion pathway protein A
MYQAFYGLKDHPFRLTPDPSFMCMTVHHQEALSGLVYSVCTRPGLTVLTGEAGTGKTTLVYSLLDLLEKRRFVTAVCTNPMLSREELFDFLIAKFGINCGSSLKNRQLSAMEGAFARYRTEGRPAVLILDEAHRLPLDLLEEVRMLLNLETPREKLLQIILSGQPELDDMLREPHLRQLKQRVSCHCRLKPLSYSELKEYVGHRLTQAGLPEQTLFPAAVLEKIYLYTQGIPRLINNLCDAALQIGFGTRSNCITLSIVDEAAKDLDLTPAALHNEARIADAVLPLADARSANGYAASFDSDTRVPLAGYASHQKNAGLFSSLMDRWR